MTLSRSPRSLLRLALNGLLVLFFLVGGAMNLLPPEAIRRDYASWGYPDGFHLVTGRLEMLAAVLLAAPRSRAYGRAVAAVVMLAALATLLVFAEHGRAAMPVIVLGALLVSHDLDVRERAARWEGRVF
jgi:uncharacterized membrane protein YphA (DoxX/SURF4 family)